MASSFPGGTTATDTTRVSGWRLWAALLICILVAAFDGFDVQAIAIAGPAIGPALKLAPVAMGQIFSSSQVGFVFGALFGGALSDRIGRRNALLSGTIGIGVFTLLTSVTGDFATLLAARVLTGLGVGVVMANLISLTVEIAPPARRAAIVSLMMAGLPGGGIIAAMVGTPLIEHHGWQALFTFGGICSLALCPLLPLIPNVRPRHDIAPESGAAGWRYALFGQDRGLTTPLLWAALFLGSCTLYLVTNWLPTLMTRRGHPLEFGHHLSAMFSLGGVIGALVCGNLVDQLGYSRVVMTAFLGVLAGVAALIFAQTEAALGIACVLSGFFVFGTLYSLNGIAPAYYPATARGLGTGASVAAGRAGSIAGPLLGGYAVGWGLAGTGGAPNWVLGLAIPLSIASGVFAFALLRRPRIL